MAGWQRFEAFPCFWRTVVREGALCALVLAYGGGCTLVYGNEIDKKQCKSDTDCQAAATALGTPLTCRDDVCQAPSCAQTSECPAGSMCEGNLCVASSPDGGTPRIACAQDGDCASTEQRCGYDGFCYAKWGCLEEEAKWPGAPANVTYVTKMQRLESPNDPTVVRNIRVEACGLVDATCERPLVPYERVTVSADGTVTVPFVNGASGSNFVGSVRFTSLSDVGASAQIVPAFRLFTDNTPLVGDMVDPISISLISPETLALFSRSLGTPLDGAIAHLVVFFSDCGGRPAPDMSASTPTAPDALFLPFSVGLLPLQGASQTSTEGIAGVLNVPLFRLHKFVLRDEGQQRVVANELGTTFLAAGFHYLVYYPRQSALQKWLAEVKRRTTAVQ